jgi:hypothetical protein
MAHDVDHERVTHDQMLPHPRLSPVYLHHLRAAADRPSSCGAVFLRNRYDKRWWMRSFFCALTRGNRSFTRNPYRSISERLDAATRRPLRPLP